MFRVRFPWTVVALLCACPCALGQQGTRTGVDSFGDPLPPGAVSRLGTTRLWHPGTIGALAFSPDGKTIASGGLYSRESEDRPTPSFTFSRDSRYLAYMLGDDPTLYLHALDNSRPARRLHPSPDRDTAAWYPCLAFSADRRMIAMTRKDEFEIDLVETLTGQLRLQLKGHEGEVASLSLSPEGRYLVSGSADTTVLVWDLKDPFGKKRSGELSEERLSQCWSALAGSNTEKAYDAILDLSHAPVSSILFLEQKLAPAKTIDPKHLTALIADLGSTQFIVRSKAMTELERHWDLCGAAIAERLKQGPALEVRRRLESLQEKINGIPPPEGLRNLRAVEVLEQIGSSASRRVLDRLTQGNPAARLTQVAREALTRLDDRPER